MEDSNRRKRCFAPAQWHSDYDSAICINGEKNLRACVEHLLASGHCDGAAFISSTDPDDGTLAVGSHFLSRDPSDIHGDDELFPELIFKKEDVEAIGRTTHNMCIDPCGDCTLATADPPPPVFACGLKSAVRQFFRISGIIYRYMYLSREVNLRPLFTSAGEEGLEALPRAPPPRRRRLSTRTRALHA
jgi:hypothetical protein